MCARSREKAKEHEHGVPGEEAEAAGPTSQEEVWLLCTWEGTQKGFTWRATRSHSAQKDDSPSSSGGAEWKQGDLLGKTCFFLKIVTLASPSIKWVTWARSMIAKALPVFKNQMLSVCSINFLQKRTTFLNTGAKSYSSFNSQHPALHFMGLSPV